MLVRDICQFMNSYTLKVAVMSDIMNEMTIRILPYLTETLVGTYIRLISLFMNIPTNDILFLTLYTRCGIFKHNELIEILHFIICFVTCFLLVLRMNVNVLIIIIIKTSWQDIVLQNKVGWPRYGKKMILCNLWLWL